MQSIDSDLSVDETLCDLLVPNLHLVVAPSLFVCPYCQETWMRGGKKEGFVKSGAYRHVHGCRLVLIYDAGYIPDRWIDGQQIALPVAISDPELVKSMKRIKHSRSKAGRFPVHPGF